MRGGLAPALGRFGETQLILGGEGQVLKFLNDNQGAVMALLTALYVIATLGIVGLTIRANKLSRASLEKAVEFERRRARPYVVFNIVTSADHHTYAVVKNLGITSAFYVKISIEPKLTYNEGGSEYELAITSEKIPFLAPGEEIIDMIDQSPVFFERYKDRRFIKGFIEYQDSPTADAACYKPEFLIDLSLRRRRNLLPEKSLADELRKLNETLTDMARHLNERKP